MSSRRIVLEGSWDLRLIVTLLLPLWAAALTAPGNPMQVLLGIVFVLIVPGYLLTAALFPRAGITQVERAALAGGGSLVASPLLALLLNLSPLGLGGHAPLIGITLFVLLGAFVVTRRRAAHALRPKPLVLPLDWPRRAWTLCSRKERRLIAAIGGTALATALLMSLLLAAPAARESFTEAALLDANGGTDAYPRRLVAGTPALLHLDIKNHEQTGAAYRVEATWTKREGGDPFPALSATDPAPGVTLDHGNRSRLPLQVIAPLEAGRYRLDVHLEKLGAPYPYRSLHLWITVERPRGQPAGNGTALPPSPWETAFVAAGPDGTPASLRRELAPGEEAQVTLIVRNVGPTAAPFHVLTRWIPVAANGTLGPATEGPTIDPTIPSGEQWTESLPLKPPGDQGRYDLYLSLAKDGPDSQPLRELWVTFTVG